ncbi:MAG: cation:proton antiporter [Myxococcota bacterium]|nr:cation:proton antiporter [Myxococcota bacterium]
MEAFPLLDEIALVAMVSVVVTVALGTLRLPTVAGLLFSGAVLGPHGFALVSDVHAIELIAEVGVVFLLFTIGLEFSLSRLKNIMQRVALGGILQVGVTAGIVTGVAYWADRPMKESIFLGFVFALSSTAIVLRALSERRELDAPHGRFIVGTLIFQDLCVVPMVLIVPLLGAADSSNLWLDVGQALGIAALLVITVFALSRLVLPIFFQWVDAQRSREVFLLAVISVCIGTAWLTSLSGLSLALGAFLGGMVVADTEYSHRAMGDILPLRDVFVSFFFVSLGMFFNAIVVVDHTTEVFALLAAFVFGKGIVATMAAAIMRFPPRAAWLAGVGLAQFGEFGFVLVRLASKEGVVPSAQLDPLLNAGIISMFLTPILVHMAPHFTAGERLLNPLSKLLGARSLEEMESGVDGPANHVVVIGYGLAGQMVTKALRRNEVEVVALELNAENVRAGRALGDPVYYADATSAEVLGHAGVESARAVVIMINDPQATLRVIDAVRRVSSDVLLYVRTQYLGEGERFVAKGADDFVAGEVEGGLELLALTLRAMNLPRNVIDLEVQRARTDSRASVRRHDISRTAPELHDHLRALKIESILVVDGSEANGQTASSLDLGRRTQALVVALRRGEMLTTRDLATQQFATGDVVYIVGDDAGICAATEVFGRTQLT